MSKIAVRLERALTAAGVAVVGVSIGDASDRSTWRVQPSNLQAAAQSIIDSFNPDAPAYVTAEKDAEIDGLKALRALAATAAAAVQSPGHFDIGGLIVVPPGNQIALGLTVALTSATYDVVMVWEDLPYMVVA